MINRYFSVVVTLCFLLFGLGACDREDGESLEKSIKLNQPDNYARYINKIAALPSGDYTIVAATSNSGESGTFTLTVTHDDASVETFTGSWSSSGGQDPASASNPKFPLTIHKAGGINIKLESSVDTYLYLVSANGLVFAQNDDIVPGSNTSSQISLASSRIDSEAYGAAYYAAIDPMGAKATLEDWKRENGFYEADLAGRVIEPRFRDTKDLGYGRGMRVWTRADGSFYAFVENFQVRTIPGLEYTVVNLDALILNDRKHHFGSNAIEFSTYPYGPGEPSDSGSTHKFAKFFTFDASASNKSVSQDHANETRLNRVNLDGRGLRAMPNACAYCHGGTQRPLRADGSYRDNTLNGSAGNGINGDVNAKLQLLEVPSFDYWHESPYTRAEQEVPIKKVNQAIYCTYPNLPSAAISVACAQFCIDPGNTLDCDGKGNDIATVFSTTTSAGMWTGGFAREMAEGWYDDPAQPGYFDRATFNENYVPVAWKPNASTGSPPAGSDQLFLEVVQPICFVCHSRRGTTLGTDENTIANRAGKDIDFSTYQKFISHADQIKTYVFDYGVMPLSLRGYNAFWGSDRPLLLAAHINGKLAADNQVKLNSAGFIDEPGVPIVSAGPDIETTSPARTFGSSSRFVNSYSWSIVSTPAGGQGASLSDADKPRALLTAPVDGDYVLRLVAGYNNKSAQDTVTIKINSTALIEPRALTFVDNIKPVFSEVATDARACDSCHVEVASIVPGLPMWWTDNQPASGTTFYQEVLARVDFNDPENSLILTKPSGNHHYGRLRPNGFDVSNPANRNNYDMILNWILEGARYSATDMREP